MSRRFSRARNERHAKALVAVVRGAGAEPDGDEFVMDTIAGPLRLTVRPNVAQSGATCFARFTDVERANAMFAPGHHNPYSGKWNHHFLTRGIIDDAHEEFRRQISRYLIREPKNDLSP